MTEQNDVSPEPVEPSAAGAAASGRGVEELCAVLCVGRQPHGRSTFTSSVDLAAAEQGVAQQVRQPTVEVQRGQAALETFSGGHQFGQVAVHAWTQACDEEVTWGQSRSSIRVECFTNYYWTSSTEGHRRRRLAGWLCLGINKNQLPV